MKDFLDECYLAIADLASAVDDLFITYPVMSALLSVTLVSLFITILFI